MATVYSLVCENGDSGTYWAGLSATEKLRYGDAGSERVYGGIRSWFTARETVTTPYDKEICEIGDAFTESASTVFEINLTAYSTLITTMVNGERSDGFHGGVSGGGYTYSTTAGYIIGVYINGYRVTLDGIDLLYSATGGHTLQIDGYGAVVKNCVVRALYTGSWKGVLAVRNANNGIVYNNLICNCDSGIQLGNYSVGEGMVFANNIITKCGSGTLSAGTSPSAAGEFYNNIVFGNYVSDWNTIPDSSRASVNNCGDSASTPWDTEGGTAVTIVEADFVDWANGDYRPANSTSPLVGAGIVVPGIDQTDIVNAPRPNYNPSGEEDLDIGPFEYDHGNGLAPQQVTLSFSGMVEGSVLSVYKDSDSSAIISPATITSSGSHSITYSYTSDTQITIKVRKASSGTKYLPYSAPGLITENGFSLIVNQVEDGVLNG